MRIAKSLLLGLASAMTLTMSIHAAEKMKMTTDIPPQITTPDSVETRLGTLKFFDGFPDDATVEKIYDTEAAGVVHDAIQRAVGISNH